MPSTFLKMQVNVLPIKIIKFINNSQLAMAYIQKGKIYWWGR